MLELIAHEQHNANFKSNRHCALLQTNKNKHDNTCLKYNIEMQQKGDSTQ